MNEEEEQTTSVYQSSQSTLPSLLEYRMDELICMGGCMQLELRQMQDHFALFLTTMFHVQYVTLQHEEQL